MKTIKKLSQTEAQKIAAGEVVERPSNIVKELIENALDAGATAVTIRAEDGGKDSLTITDNGCGMSKEDVLICFERHTTSKITSVDELPSIQTFGFRGEALASICSVAKVTITSKEKNALEGTRIHVENGKLLSQETIGCAHGTTISIQSLFYNIPARKKFLKTTATEWNHVITLFKAYALNNPTIHFILEHEGSTSYNCPPVSTIQERIAQLFEHSLSTHTVPLVKMSKSGITVEGVITTQQYGRYDKGGMFFFVNRRWVKNYQLAQAVTKGYLNLLPSGRYPAACIALTIDPHTVDVNVHPKKEEVQFLHPKTVTTVLTETVKTTLEKNLSEHLKQTVRIIPAIEKREEPVSFMPPPLVFSQKQSVHPLPPPPFPIVPPEPPKPTSSVIKEKQHATTSKNSFRLIGQYRQTYLLLEHTDGLFILDQHAAHERVLYEQFSKRFKDTATVQLLFPQTVSFSSEDVSLLAPYLFLLQEHGIACEPFSATELVIKGTPIFLKNHSLHDTLQEMVSLIKEESGVEERELFKKITERLRAQMACKAAVKAGDELSWEKMEKLLHDLESTENRFTCPHGRPTSWLLPLSDLERKFKRRL